ncbi:multifunctional CCA addition/repair protein [Candidatus Profftia sp. (ex Adelges kitamiensis)]|uniref:multifunctional CCA addition/repair protein n=1 Tax=Candidatus Profftia sp. (ex Adelges kitamiensis) TaxID=2864218 RepID=UPI001CE34B8B|nr:multifunctional CCA addition/repair protein [Candidatus Profftia sp. (ex Adelges kitamiensis)]
MKVFLVGGAIRDKKLNLPIYDRDWVIEGATPEELITKGFQQVGKDFPVFLHNESHEEYALARTEHKLGHGYTGFITYFSPDVTIEQDLIRRDLTINAMAESPNGTLIDPYGGLQDLNNKVLRHVSEAFREDPLRVLRAARFAARFAHLGFHIAPETMELMKQMITDNEINHLTPERIWCETKKALKTQNPQIYFQLLRDCGALAILLPEIDNLFGISMCKKLYPTIDMGIHALISLEIVAKITEEIDVRFATLTCNLSNSLPHYQYCLPHHKNKYSEVSLIEMLCHRIRIPNSIRELAKIVSKYNNLLNNIEILEPEMLLILFNSIDVWRKPKRLEQIIMIHKACIFGYTNTKDKIYSQGSYLRSAYKIIQNISVRAVIDEGFKGQQISKELRRRHLSALSQWKHDISSKNIY